MHTWALQATGSQSESDMTEPSPTASSSSRTSSATRPPLAPAASSSPSNDDVSLHHRSISDDAPSPSAAGAPPPVFTSAKASASAFASKLAFGGRKLLSPLAGVTTGSSSSSHHAQSSPGESKTPFLKTGSGLPASSALASSLAGANAAVSDAASAVTSSLSSLFAGGLGGSTAYPLSTASPSSTAPLSSSSNSGAIQQLDAAELEQLEAEYRQVTAQQRMQILEDLVQHRRADWSYLKAMHVGTSYWLNIALLKETHVLAHLGERAAIRRSVQFFYLGLGLGKLMSEVRHAQLLAMEGCQLLEELEFYFASATVQSMKLMVATSTPSLHEPLHKMDDEELLATALHEPFRPTIYKWNQRAVFRRLVTPSIPFPLDYREVMLSLCDILALVYSKLVEDNTCSENVFLFQAIVRFDEKIKKLVIDPVKKEFSAVAATVVAEELVGVRREFSSSGGSVSSGGPSSRHASHSNAIPIPATATSPIAAPGATQVSPRQSP